MLKDKNIDKLVLVIVAFTVVFTIAFMNGEKLGIQPISSNPSYANRLFDDSYVHTIDIRIDDWEEFLENPLEEEYHMVDLIIDDEYFESVGLRTKGNNSLRITEKYGSDRFSLKVEMDHYGFNHYYGLDKFSLDSSFQDNSYLKSYLAYDMFEFMDVPTPLTSFVWVTVNGEPWGLFLAVEEPEESFAQRNYGRDYGQLYKPDYKWLDADNADVDLRYIDDNPDSYDNIFRKAKFNPSVADQRRLIESLEILAEGKDIESAVDIDAILRYFVPQVFVVNIDSYTGITGHNYFLYEEEGLLTMLPWDYNLAFATYSLGMTNPINDAELYINHPIDTPAAGEIMTKRPMFHHIMLVEEYYQQYHQYFDYFIKEYFESGHFEEVITEVTTMISPYVKEDPIAWVLYEDYELAIETITNFSLLRAESIRNQLDGIIPSNIKGQLEDQSNFVDGSAVWLPDMGEIADIKDKNNE
jgi:spore coat protein CotH